MRAGMVTSIRINPHDCQCIIALMYAMGMDPYDGKSWAANASLAMQSMVAFCIKMGIIEEPDPFQFMNKMGPFLGSGNNRKKAARAENLYFQALKDGSVPVIEPPRLAPMNIGQSIPAHIGQAPVGQGREKKVIKKASDLDPETRAACLERYEALNELFNQGPLGPEDLAEYRDLDSLFMS